MFICLCPLIISIFFVCHCVCFIDCVLFARFFSSNVNCIVYAHMYVHSFNYLLNKLELGGYTYLQLKKKENYPEEYSTSNDISYQALGPLFS